MGKRRRWRGHRTSRAGAPRQTRKPARRAAVGGARAVIIETIVTTRAADGAINCAPMGVEWGDSTIVLKPYLETATFRNLADTGSAVINLTDDVRVFAKAAISNPEYPTVPAAAVDGVV